MKANYGIDAPKVVRLFLLLGTAGVLAGALFISGRFVAAGWAIGLGWASLSIGCTFLLNGLVMLWGSKIGKVRFAEKVIASLAWRGDERVLDIGCGHGLMLVTAAKKLPRGKAIGVDLWQTEDQAGNRPEATLANAQIEDVAERVEVRDGDARNLPFENNSFDAVVSSWALHNIYDRAGRDQAVREIMRVLRPGGQIALIDIRHTDEYAQALREAGLSLTRHGPNFLFVIPTRWLIAKKPIE